MVLWILFAVLTVLVLLRLLWPLAKLGAAQPDTLADVQAENAAFDTEVYRDQLREIETDEDRGLISKDDAESARIEISRRLLSGAKSDDRKADDAVAERSAPAAATAHAGLIYATAMLVPAVTLGVYLLIGQPDLPSQPFAARAQKTIAGADTPPNVKELVSKVEAILKKNPQDGRGWAVIAPVYLRLQRYNDSVEAYKRAIAINGADAKTLSGYGEALRLANAGVINEDARMAYAEALKIDKSLIVPKIALAMARAQDGQFALAAKDLRLLLKTAEADAPWRELVTQQVATFENRAGMIRTQIAKAGQSKSQSQSQSQSQVPRGSTSGRLAKKSGGAAPGNPDADDIKAAQDMSGKDRSAMINQMVSGLADRLKNDKQNLAGWMRLIQSYKVLNRKNDAVKALKTARKNFAQDKAALAKLNMLAKNLGIKA